VNKKRAADTTIFLVFIAITLIAGFYREQLQGSSLFIWGAGAGAVIFLIQALRDKESFPRSLSEGQRNLPTDSQVITEAVLLSEENTELMAWDMYGKTSLVIGREGKDCQADIDLQESPFAGMVDREHAVLNFSAGSWFVEDLGSANGLSIKKDDRKIYRLSPNTLCRVERGDCLYVGRNCLLFR